MEWRHREALLLRRVSNPSSPFQGGPLLGSGTMPKNGGWWKDCTSARFHVTRLSRPGHCCSANHPKRGPQRSGNIAASRPRPGAWNTRRWRKAAVTLRNGRAIMPLSRRIPDFLDLPSVAPPPEFASGTFGLGNRSSVYLRYGGKWSERRVLRSRLPDPESGALLLSYVPLKITYPISQTTRTSAPIEMQRAIPQPRRKEKHRQATILQIRRTRTKNTRQKPPRNPRNTRKIGASRATDCAAWPSISGRRRPGTPKQ